MQEGSRQTNPLHSLLPANLNYDAGVSALLLAARPPLTQQPRLQFLVQRLASGPPLVIALGGQYQHDGWVPKCHEGYWPVATCLR